MDQRGGSLFGLLRSAIVFLGCRNVAVPGKLLNERDIGSGIEEVAHESSPEIVG